MVKGGHVTTGNIRCKNIFVVDMSNKNENH